MNSETKVEEQFSVLSDTKLKKIQFYTITWNNQFEDNQLLNVTIMNERTGKVIYKTSIRMASFVDGGCFNINISDNITLDKDTKYDIIYDASVEPGQYEMALMLTNHSKNSELVYINGKKKSQHISQKLWTQNTSKLSFK